MMVVVSRVRSCGWKMKNKERPHGCAVVEKGEARSEVVLEQATGARGAVRMTKCRILCAGRWRGCLDHSLLTRFVVGPNQISNETRPVSSVNSRHSLMPCGVEGSLRTLRIRLRGGCE